MKKFIRQNFACPTSFKTLINCVGRDWAQILQRHREMMEVYECRLLFCRLYFMAMLKPHSCQVGEKSKSKFADRIEDSNL